MLRLPPELRSDAPIFERDPPDGDSNVNSDAAKVPASHRQDSSTHRPARSAEPGVQAPDMDNPLSQAQASPYSHSDSPSRPSPQPFDDKGLPLSLSSHGKGESRWYLGIDVGSTGISAVLLNQEQQCLYPISWSYVEQANSSQKKPQESPSSPWFRLPTTVLLYFSGHDTSSVLMPKWGWDEQTLNSQASDLDPSVTGQMLLLRSSKDYLNITIPHYSSQSGRWEPEILHGGRSVSLNQSYSLPLSGFFQALQMLFATLSPSLPSIFAPTPSTPSTRIESRVWGLSPEQAQRALQSLAGVVVGYPRGWTAAYRFNVREAVLGARLVSRANQVVMVGDAIATLLSRLPSADGTPITLPPVFKQASLNSAPNYHGPTLVINSGAVTTELAIAHVSPPRTQSLSALALQTPLLKPNNFLERSLAYGGDALDQDIISQILYPRLAQLGAAMVEVLGTIDLILPSAGEPDEEQRLLLQRQLHLAPLGPELIQQARRLKLALQTQKTSPFTLAHHQWTIHQEELGNRVLLPYVQRLHRDVNALLDRVGMEANEIHHIICSGGTASLRFITIWLQQTFPQALIIQDIHQGNPSSTLDYNIVPTCSRVAYGLASLPMHPHLMDWATHQPCDYDLLMEMGRTLPARPLTLGDILHHLKRRGISPSISQACVMALLDGQIPAGLVPKNLHRYHLTEQSQEYVPYDRLLAAPLFEAIDDDRSAETIYRPNRQQWILLQQYLTALTAGTRQTLFQPLVGMEAGTLQSSESLDQV